MEKSVVFACPAGGELGRADFSFLQIEPGGKLT